MQKRILLVTTLVFSFFNLSANAKINSEDENQFIQKTVSVNGFTIPYLVHLPMGYTATKKWPVILFLHGSGERGSDGVAPAKVGLGPAILLHPDWFPAIVVMPQCPNDLRWTSQLSDDESSPWMKEMAMAALDEASGEYNGDLNRTTLTGVSLGGEGAWVIGAAYLARFAALMPIAGRVPTSLAPVLKNKEIWVFHGEKDPVVPVSFSRNMVAALKQNGAKDLTYTEVPNYGHEVWNIAYANRKAIQFLIR